MTIDATLPGVTHEYVEARGARFHVARAAVPGGHPVVLLHGIPMHWYLWRTVIAELASEYDLYCVDLRGCGWSTATRRGYATTELAADVLAVLDGLRLDRVRLIGHETGGWVGFELCLTAPERFEGLLAVNVAHPWLPRKTMLREAWRFWYTAFWEYPGVGRTVLRRWPGLTRFLLRRWAGRQYTWDPAELEEFVRHSRSRGASRAIEQMLWQFVRHDIPALIRGAWRRRELTVPAMVLTGELDPVTGPVPAAAGVRAEVVPGGHLLPHTAPRLVAAAARELFG